jgi:hypothetical protein
MKTLKEYINESLLDDFDEIEKSVDARELVIQFLKDNYRRALVLKVSEKPNKDGYYEVDCSRRSVVEVYNKDITSLTNDLFIFVNIKGSFDCRSCKKLTSLEGAPKEVGGNFNCSYCHNLISLKGAPQKVGDIFNCSYCDNLTSLEGAPKEVEGNFYCYSCKNLTSLKGAPEEIKYIFDLSNCPNLTSLEGAPKKVRTWYNLGNVQSFDEYDIKKVCSVTKILT